MQKIVDSVGGHPVEMISASGITAIVLAAGLSRRMQERNKLLVDFKGHPLLRRVVDALLGSILTDIIMVTGYQADAIQHALADTALRFVHNADYEKGLSTSLQCGIKAVPATAKGAMICLGDMPLLKSTSIDALLQAFDEQHGDKICVPVYQHECGNPVLWPRRFFPSIRQSTGDIGARWLIKSHPESVHEVVVNDAGVLRDIDTLEDLQNSHDAL
ncbi:MAG: nucleotidyltransferase family protein [Gammaproteobacteria bacterium]|nr:nucleotidyltransferase family protein [Gammaproteobacteria bacterium]